MDPLTAVGLVANIIQFVGLGSRIFNIAEEIHQSSSGTTRDIRRTKDVVNEMFKLTVKLQETGEESSNDNEKALQRLAAQYAELSQHILEYIKKVAPEDPRSKFQSFWSSFKGIWYEKDKAELERKLDDCRSQLGIQLSYVSRCVWYWSLQG
jgi:hypothetical protein